MKECVKIRQQSRPHLRASIKMLAQTSDIGLPFTAAVLAEDGWLLDSERQ